MRYTQSIVLAASGLLLSGAPGAAAEPAGRESATIVVSSTRAGERSIWRVGPGPGEVRRLTDPPTPGRPCGCRHGERDSGPAWSPDGRFIAFMRGARIVIASAEGSVVTVVAAPRGAEDYEPSWSTRNRLGFLRQRPAASGSGYVHEIVTVDARGRAARTVAPASRFAYRSFAWSTDGRQLAYTVPYLAPQFVVGLFVKEVPDGRPRFLVRAAGMGELSWSPDDRTLALAAALPGAEPFDPYRLFSIRVVARRIRQLTRHASSKIGDGFPRWSPGGKLIAFTRTGPASDAVFVVKPDGRGQQVIATDARGGAWAPGGSLLAVVRGVSGRGESLTLVSIDVRTRAPTSHARLRHPADAEFLGAQAWRPTRR